MNSLRRFARLVLVIILAALGNRQLLDGGVLPPRDATKPPA